MGNLLEEILKGAMSGDGSVLGDIIKKAGYGQQEEESVETETSMNDNTKIPQSERNSNPFDIGNELDDIAHGRNQGTKTATSEEEEVGIPSMGGIDLGEIFKKIIVGGGAIPTQKEEEEVETQAPTTQTIDIGDILGKLGLGLGSSGSGGFGGILQTIIQVIKMLKGSPLGQRAGFIEEQLSEYFTPDQISQLMAAADEVEEEKEEEDS